MLCKLLIVIVWTILHWSYFLKIFFVVVNSKNIFINIDRIRLIEIEIRKESEEKSSVLFSLLSFS